MKQIASQSQLDDVQDDCQVIGEFFDPFSALIKKASTKEVDRIQSETVFCKLLTYGDEQNQNQLEFSENSSKFISSSVMTRDENLVKILTKQKSTIDYRYSYQHRMDQPQYSFNYDKKQVFKQTPCFKSSLQSPFRSFSKNYKFEIQQLKTTNISNEKFQQIRKDKSPLLYLGRAAAYFIGISLDFQANQHLYESLFFLHLACFVEPFNLKVWQEYISFVKKHGLWERAAILAKTAFLLNQTPDFSEEYLHCGDKAELPMFELRGLLSSINNFEKYEKTIIESAKYEIKSRKLWRGVLLLNKLISLSNFRSNIGTGIILLSKHLQSIGFHEVALDLLRKSIEQGLPKFQAFSIYIQITLRTNSGIISEKDILFLDQHADNLTVETRYRLWLSLAQVLLKSKNRRFEEYVGKAYKSASKFCKGLGKERAFREIYFMLITSLNLSPNHSILQQFKFDGHLKFLLNRHKFISGEQMTPYKFTNWKYYLHLTLLKDPKILMQAFQQHNQGRIMAQAIHILRLTHDPLNLLKLWRQKIQQIPKSGQLWCEGGRIYVNIGQISNAIKCFESAIHFTPQYGDSFIELLAIHLRLSNFKSAHDLRKKFQVSEPYYGNVHSFLQQIYRITSASKLSLRKVWEHASEEIKYAIYSRNSSKAYKWTQLTASVTYNQAFVNQSSWEVREILFNSYELMENKNSRI